MLAGEINGVKDMTLVEYETLEQRQERLLRFAKRKETKFDSFVKSPDNLEKDV